MSKKMAEHERLFKKFKAGLIKSQDLTARERALLIRHYPFLGGVYGKRT